MASISTLVDSMESLSRYWQTDYHQLEQNCHCLRVNLAWKSVCAIPMKGSHILDTRKLVAYFRKSGSRTKKLKAIAAANNFNKPLRYPVYFEVRWSEFTFNLFNAVLRNWRSTIKYFESTTFWVLMNQWLVLNKLHLITFLIDVLGLLKAFQKTCQSDTISLLDVIQKETWSIYQIW